jgi:hypothetical protein
VLARQRFEFPADVTALKQHAVGMPDLSHDDFRDLGGASGRR